MTTLDDDTDNLSFMPAEQFSEWLDEFLCRLFSLLQHLEPSSVLYVLPFLLLYMCTPSNSELCPFVCLFLVIHITFVLQEWRCSFTCNIWNIPSWRWSSVFLHVGNIVWKTFEIFVQPGIILPAHTKFKLLFLPLFQI